MSAEKTLEILDLFSYTNRNFTVSEIAEGIDQPRSSVYRYVRLLKERGFLREHPPGYYSLGYKFLKYYRIIKMDTNLSLVAEEPMKRLTKKFNETTMLLVYSNLQTVCLSTVNSNNKIKVTSEPGEIVPLYAGGSSKALLAFLDEEIVEELYNNTEIVQYTDKTITSLSKMKAHLAEIREKGFASSSGELYEGVVGYGVPIYDSDNHAIASLSISGLKERMESLDENELVDELKKAAKEIQEYL